MRRWRSPESRVGVAGCSARRKTTSSKVAPFPPKAASWMRAAVAWAGATKTAFVSGQEELPSTTGVETSRTSPGREEEIQTRTTAPAPEPTFAETS